MCGKNTANTTQTATNNTLRPRTCFTLKIEIHREFPKMINKIYKLTLGYITCYQRGTKTSSDFISMKSQTV